jgi:MoaA/NifB/PqqE/SkfB family radical SAM enzyme
LQKKNFLLTPDMVDFARSLGVDRVSFLAADVFSAAFGRDSRGLAAPDSSIVLTEEETIEFRRIVDRMVREQRREFDRGFISESPSKMYHIVRYYEAVAGRCEFPRNHCNAPMVSAVITSTGIIQPCFFLPGFGNTRNGPIERILNTAEIRSVRRQVRSYTLERCHTCVCTLHVRPTAALLDSF